MRTIFLLIISVFIAAFSHAQDSLKILTWNIQMLPSIVKGGGKAKRSEAIVNQLNARNYDVIVFQEIFNKRSRKIITRGLLENYPHRTPVLNRKTLALKSNGGVMIFSKHPIREMHEIRYSKRTGYDRLARKGALLAEIEYKHNTIQVAGTHLQAFGAQEIMYSQYKQLIDELLKPHTKKGVPQFVCGDFNTLKSIPPELPTTITQEFINRLPRYPIMLHTLDAHDGDLAGDQQFTMDRPYNDLCKKRKEYRLLLDYILFRSNGITPPAISRQVRIMREPWHKDHKDLSDHFGLEAIISGMQ